MSLYVLYYGEANLVCIIIFGILFLHDLLGIDRQEKQILYDRTLIAFMMYFASDIFWAALIGEAITRTLTNVLIINLMNAILMAVITYTWFRYALAVQLVSYRNKPSFRLITAIPLILSITIAIIVYLIDPSLFFDAELNLQPVYPLFQVGVPIAYIIAELTYTIRRAAKEKSLSIKRKLISVGLFPFMVVVGGLIQVAFLPNLPIFCFSSTILMILFYIQSMEGRISLDPLTGLNNRTQLYRYIAQDSTMHREGRQTYVGMIDVNDFKDINDTYGHSNGDEALIIIADSLRRALGEVELPGFLGRFGGDEFIVIAHPTDSSEMIVFEQAIRDFIHEGCVERGMPFDISIGMGYDRLNSDIGDTFQHCMERADKKLYVNKGEVKEQMRNTSKFE